MKVLHVIPAFYPAHVYGGPITSAYQLCCSLVKMGLEIRVLTTDANGLSRVLDVEKDREIAVVERSYIRYCRRIMRHSISPTLLRLLPSYISWADLVHLTAVYSFPTIPTLLTCRALGKTVIWSPRGALQRWRGTTRHGSKALWEWVCRYVAPHRCTLHFTSEEEARESIERLPGFEAVVIPNGAEIPAQVIHARGNGQLRLLYIGRLHPIKGIENLLLACKNLSDSSSIAWALILAGSGDQSYTERLRALIREQALAPQVQMVGEVIGEAKQRLFEKADVVVVPSYSENFGMVVTEALAYGVPVIASKGTPWKRVEEIGCGLWINNDPETLAWGITQMSKMPLCEMGQRGRVWMEREFSWRLVAEKMGQVYQSLVVHST